MTSYFTPPLEELDYLVLAVYYDFCFCCYYYPVLAGVAVGLAPLRCLVDLDLSVVKDSGFLADLAIAAFDYCLVVAVLVLAVVFALVADVDSDYDFALADLD